MGVLSQREKARYYAGILALLEHENLTSISLSVSYRDAVSRGLGMSMEEFGRHMDFAYKNLDTEASGVYVNWKKI